MPDATMNQMPPADVIAQQNDKQVMQRLQQEFGKAASAVKQQSDDDMSAAYNQFLLKQRAMRVKFERERDPARRQSIEQQMMDIRTQYDGKIQAVKDKYHPTNRTMKSAYDAEVGKLQQAAQKRSEKLQNIRQLHKDGFITDEAVVRQAEYKMLLGIDVPLSQLRPQQGPDPKEIKATLIRDIGNIDKMLERFTPIRERTLLKDKGIWWGHAGGKYVDPETREERKLNPKKPEDKAIMDDRDNLIRQQGELRKALHANMLAEDPAYGQIFRDQEDRQKAKKDYLDPGAKGGSIEGSITNTIAEQNKGKRIRVQSPGGQTGTVTEKELASYMAQGYKRI